ncbi:MAG: PilZ domain-containing protein [Phycisphaerales bacterium]|jgi:hypothetical protein|nr:PilZ domain-containing protein [Phycisphaerales bacterium]
MTTLSERNKEQNNEQSKFRLTVEPAGAERREHRRHDMEEQGLKMQRWDGQRGGSSLGRIVDISAGGIRIRTGQKSIRPDQQIRVRLELPVYAGICPFVDTTGSQMAPKREWTGWMSISRVHPISDKQVEVAGRLVDMNEMDRGMLGLYLSTQPLAA